LAQSGIPYTLLRPNFFMQNTLMQAGTIANDGKFYGSMKDGKASMVDIRDVAAVAAAVVTGAGHEGKTYIITGPEALTFSDIARKFSAALGKPVEYVDLPRGALIEALMGFGLPDWAAQGIAELHDWGIAGGSAEVTDVVARIGNTNPTSFDQFAKDFAPAFHSAATAR
jgi:uncharacterized protein YbjT (DUF2867 family)